jgi:hypothetical protein
MACPQGRGLVIGLEKRKLAKKKEKEKVPAEGEPVHSVEARDATQLSKKKTELGTNKAQLNLTQHG